MKYKNVSDRIMNFPDSKLKIYSVGPGQEINLPDDEEFHFPNLKKLDETLEK